MTNGFVIESPTSDFALSFGITFIRLKKTSALVLVDQLIRYCGCGTFTSIPQQLSRNMPPLMFHVQGVKFISIQ